MKTIIILTLLTLTACTFVAVTGDDNTITDQSKEGLVVETINTEQED